MTPVTRKMINTEQDHRPEPKRDAKTSKINCPAAYPSPAASGFMRLRGFCATHHSSAVSQGCTKVQMNAESTMNPYCFTTFCRHRGCLPAFSRLHQARDSFRAGGKRISKSHLGVEHHAQKQHVADGCAGRHGPQHGQGRRGIRALCLFAQMATAVEACTAKPSPSKACWWAPANATADCRARSSVLIGADTGICQCLITAGNTSR